MSGPLRMDPAQKGNLAHQMQRRRVGSGGAAGDGPRALALRVVDLLHSWPGPGVPTATRIARALDVPLLDIGRAVDHLRARGMMAWSGFALSPSMMLANDGAAPVAAKVAPAPVPAPAPEPALTPAPDADPLGGYPRFPPMERSAVGNTDEAAQRALAVLKFAAAGGLPCPTNDQIGALIGTTGAIAGGVVGTLARGGIIDREYNQQHRRIRLCASGDATDYAGPTGNARRGKLVARASDGNAWSLAQDERAAVEARAAQVERDRAARQAELLAAESAPRAGGALERGAARSTDALTTPALTPRELTIGQRVQLDALADRAGSAATHLRDGWPVQHDLLTRICVTTHERPLQLLARLISDEAGRHGLRANHALTKAARAGECAGAGAADDSDDFDDFDEGDA